MLPILRIMKTSLVLLAALCSGLNAVSTIETNNDEKIQVVLALPFRPDVPFDAEHWYTPDYIDYIAELLPKDRYNLTGYFVSLNTIPKFLDDMQALYAKHKNLRVLNFCDGGEWDGYPGISVVRLWEQHAISTLVPLSGADTQFIFNSDDKTTMNNFIRKANLKYMPQAVVKPEMIENTDYAKVVADSGLDKVWPLFCKLNIGWGALGITPSSICYNVDQLKAQMKKMSAEFPTSDILIQPYLVGPEYTVLVIKDKVYTAVRRDYQNPYNLMLDDYLFGRRPVDEEILFFPATEEAKALAVKATQAIPGKYHYVRIDLRNDAFGNTYVLDINDRPGIGHPSTINYMLEYNKQSLSQLLIELINTCETIK